MSAPFFFLSRFFHPPTPAPSRVQNRATFLCSSLPFTYSRRLLRVSPGWAWCAAGMVAPTSESGSGRGACPFYRQGNDWFCKTGLPSDIGIEVDGIFFHLHKFPLLSKCGKIAHIVEESQKSGEMNLVLVGCPGGPDAFLLAARFCYGCRVELTPKNIVMAYCAAEYLEMTEEYDEENLLARAESFFHKVVLRSWKDCILALENTEDLISKVESFHIMRRCLGAISMMVCTDPSLFGWPMMMYGSSQSPGGSILWNGINTGARIRSSLSDWWFEDISCLGVSVFKRLIETMRERGIRSENIAGVLMYYARKYLPGLDRWQSGQGVRRKKFASIRAAVDQKVLLESIETLLPEKKGRAYCRFLLGLLRLAMILDVSQSCRCSLERRIGMQLELATLDGLLIPNFSNSDNLYDTDCVERIIRHFTSSQAVSVTLFSPSSLDPATSPSSSPQRKVTKLIDSYLSEIAPDVNLKPEKMHSLMEALPESLRPLDDGLYKALDIYFKAHPWLPEDEREQLCSIIDYRRLSIDACAHASHNERLPLRIVLQVLFFEQLQLRTALSRCLHVQDSDSTATATATADDMAGQILQRDGWVSLVRENQGLRVDMEHMRSRVRELEREFITIKQEMGRMGGSYSSIGTTRIVPRRLGCMAITQSNDPHSATIKRMSPSQRHSVEKHGPSHSSSHN